MPQKKVPRVSNFIEHIDGPIKPSPRSVTGQHAPISHKITPPPVPNSAIPPPKKAPVKEGEGSCCGCVIM